MKKTAILSALIICSIALTGCSGGKNESSAPETSSTTSESTTASTTPESTTSAPETAEDIIQVGTPEPEVPLRTEEAPAESAENTAEAEAPQVAELIGMTIGDVESLFDTELAPNETGYLGSHTFGCVGRELAFTPLAESLADNYKDSVVTGIFTNNPCPLLDGITGQMSYNELSAYIDDPEMYAPEPNAIDGSTSTMFFYKGYKFMVMWADYADNDSPCYSITVTAE